MTRNPHKNPNPQGKGDVPVLRDWYATRAIAVEAKAPGELLLDWFVSTLVLSAEFRFRPVPGQRYFLYHGDERWRLSLVAPEEWGHRSPGVCLGDCMLKSDMTWALNPRAENLEHPDLRAALGDLVEGFTAVLESDEEVDALLPGYRRELPYYQRMLATGLGSSLRESAKLTDFLGKPAELLLAAAGDELPLRLASSSTADAG